MQGRWHNSTNHGMQRQEWQNAKENSKGRGKGQLGLPNKEDGITKLTKEVNGEKTTDP